MLLSIPPPSSPVSYSHFRSELKNHVLKEAYPDQYFPKPRTCVSMECSCGNLQAFFTVFNLRAFLYLLYHLINVFPSYLLSLGRQWPCFFFVPYYIPSSTWHMVAQSRSWKNNYWTNTICWETTAANPNPHCNLACNTLSCDVLQPKTVAKDKK